jgi:hypothetical protein
MGFLPHLFLILQDRLQVKRLDGLAGKMFGGLE